MGYDLQLLGHSYCHLLLNSTATVLSQGLEATTRTYN